MKLLNYSYTLNNNSGIFNFNGEKYMVPENQMSYQIILVILNDDGTIHGEFIDRLIDNDENFEKRIETEIYKYKVYLHDGTIYAMTKTENEQYYKICKETYEKMNK